MKILFLQYSHPTIHSIAHNLSISMAKLGHEIHWIDLYHKKKPSKKNKIKGLNFSYYTLSNPYGNQSGALLYDVRSALTPRLIKVLNEALPRFSSSANDLIHKIQPELIITEGIIALSVISHLNVNLLLPGGIVPWIHYFDEDYKYAPYGNQQTKKYALNVLKENIKQPDAIWASKLNFAQRVHKDYNLATLPTIVTRETACSPQKSFEKSTHGEYTKILVNSLDIKQMILLKVMMDSMDLAKQKTCIIFDTRPQWPINITGSTPTKIIPKQSPILSNRVKNRLKRAVNLPIIDERKSPLVNEESLSILKIIEHCKGLGAQYLGGIHYSSQYQYEGFSFKKAVIISLVNKNEFIKAVTDHLKYAHKIHVLVLNGDLSALSTLTKVGKTSISTDDIANPKRLNHLLITAVENLVTPNSPKYILKKEKSVLTSLESNLQSVIKLCEPVSIDGPLKVWHGLTGCAGQPWIQSNAQLRAGIHSQSVIVGPNYLKYKVHKQYSAQNIKSQARALVEINRNFNVAHFYFRSLFYESIQLAMPACLDMLALRAAQKTVIMNFRGSEVRLQNDFEDINPYHYVDEAPPAVTKFPDETQRRYIKFARAVCSEMVVIDPELGSYVPDAKIIPRSLNLDDWVYIGQKNKVKPIVVHAPTKADIKGTSHVLNAIDNLKKEGLDFEFRLIQGLSNKEAQEAYKEADIIIDQLRIGWYGVLSVEAMALGKAVICYIRDDLIEENFPLTNRPFCIANPDTIIDNLRELILSPKLRQDYAEKGYEYCRNVHDSDKIALQYIDLYEKARKEPKPINLGEVFDFIEWQENLIASDTDNLVAQIRKKMGTI